MSGSRTAHGVVRRVINQVAVGTASGATNRPTIEVATANMATQDTHAETRAAGFRRTVSVSESDVTVTGHHLTSMPEMYRATERRVAPKAVQVMALLVHSARGRPGY
jgi:hypothetical protein